MITVLIFAVIGVIKGIKDYRDEYYGWDDWLTCLLHILGYGLFFLLIGLAVAFMLPQRTKTTIEKYELVALRDNSSVEGRMFLGSGRVDGKMVFTFYYKEGDYFNLKQVDAKDAKIHITQGEPHVERIYEKPTKSIINWFALDANCSKYIIHVPEGTIQNNYILDAQ